MGQRDNYVRLAANIRPDQKEWLRRLRRQTGEDMSHHVRQALNVYQRYLNEQSRKEIDNDT